MDESFAQSHTAVAVLGPEAPTFRSMRFLWTPESSFKSPVHEHPWNLSWHCWGFYVFTKN